jgi:hypothetical protein
MQVPVDLNVVTLYRTAGVGDTLKSATGAWACAVPAVAEMSAPTRAAAEMIRRKRVPPWGLCETHRRVTTRRIDREAI